MKTKPLGNSGLEVPVICLGTMTWGNQNTEDEAHEQLDYAVDERGINFIDTAEMYPIPPTSELQGRTETYIGNWLAKRGKRDDLILASKVGNAAPLISTRDCDGKYNAQNINDAIDGSLARLQTDYLDLYQVHWPERNSNFFGKRGYQHNDSEDPTPILETLEALSELVKSGKVRHIGISNESPWGTMEYLRLAREHNLPVIASIQNQYSLTNRLYEIGMAEVSMRENVPLLAYSALNMGVLTGKYLNGARPEGARFTISERNNARYDTPTAQTAVQKYVNLAKKFDMDPATLALAFAHSREFCASVIIGASRMDQLKTNIDAGEVELSEEMLNEIDAIYQEHPDVTC
jgi:aryl-alcohol dehydrogenase-like predicted oxidoreductase